MIFTSASNIGRLTQAIMTGHETFLLNPMEVGLAREANKGREDDYF